MNVEYTILWKLVDMNTHVKCDECFAVFWSRKRPLKANVKAAEPIEKPSDDGPMVVDAVLSTSQEGAPVTERSHQEGRQPEDDDRRANDGDDRRANDGEQTDPVTVVSTVNIRMQRPTVVYPNGFVDIMRTTDFTFSEDIDPARVNYNKLLRDILSKVPLHYQNMDRHPNEDQ